MLELKIEIILENLIYYSGIIYSQEMYCMTLKRQVTSYELRNAVLKKMLLHLVITRYLTL